jgi:D-alanyl-D-alanine carboxypeptidase (penicillin-binding protein 5/6)
MSVDALRFIGRERVTRLGRYIVGAVLAVLVALAGVQWFRPVPSPVFRSALSTSVRLPGSPPSLPWSTTGSAALAVEGVGTLWHGGSTKPAPVAGLVKVMTAYVVLKDHSLARGVEGPAIPVTAATLAAAQADVATQQSVVPVTAGETLTELEALEGLLVAQGNDMATLLSDWDAGSTAAFVAKMNTAAHEIGLGSTSFSDPSGLDPGSVSTPADMIRLGEAAMAIPAFAQVVAMPQVTLPLAGVVYNFDYDLGLDGIVGIKTGSDAAAGGCFLFDAKGTVGGKNVTLVGAVLGQHGTSPVTAALFASDLLVKRAFAVIGTFHPVRPGHLVGRIVAPWAPSVPVTASKSPTIVGWPGLAVPARVQVGALPSAISSGARIGVLRVQNIDVVLRTSRRLPRPSVIWRLTRL